MTCLAVCPYTFEKIPKGCGYPQSFGIMCINSQIASHYFFVWITAIITGSPPLVEFTHDCK